VISDKTAAGRAAARESGNHSTTVENRLITMEDKAEGKENQQTGANIKSGKRLMTIVKIAAATIAAAKVEINPQKWVTQLMTMTTKWTFYLALHESVQMRGSVVRQAQLAHHVTWLDPIDDGEMVQ